MTARRNVLPSSLPAPASSLNLANHPTEEPILCSAKLSNTGPQPCVFLDKICFEHTLITVEMWNKVFSSKTISSWVQQDALGYKD